MSDQNSPRSLKQIFEDLHDEDPDLAHLFISWLIKKYGRHSPEVTQLYTKQ